MKSAIIKSFMVVFIVIALVHYALYLRTGRLPWGESSPGMPSFSKSLPTSLPKSLPTVESLTSGGKTQVYKWVDENGVIHYSQEPPPEEAQAQAQSLELDPANLNVMAAPVPQEAPASSPVVGGPSSFDDGKTPIEKAREAAELLQARDQAQKKMLDSL